jgi:hypothetical protein
MSDTSPVDCASCEQTFLAIPAHEWAIQGGKAGMNVGLTIGIVLFPACRHFGYFWVAGPIFLLTMACTAIGSIYYLRFVLLHARVNARRGALHVVLEKLRYIRPLKQGIMVGLMFGFSMGIMFLLILLAMSHKPISETVSAASFVAFFAALMFGGSWFTGRDKRGDVKAYLNQKYGIRFPAEAQSR